MECLTSCEADQHQQRPNRLMELRICQATCATTQGTGKVRFDARSGHGAYTRELTKGSATKFSKHHCMRSGTSRLAVDSYTNSFASVKFKEDAANETTESGGAAGTVVSAY